MNFLKWATDDISWAITVVGVILIVYAVGSFAIHGSCDNQVLSSGITGIVALARGNGKNNNSAPTPPPGSLEK